MQGGNPEVKIPSGFDKSTISYVDLTTLDNPATQLVNLNADKFHDSSWKITTNLPSYVSEPPSCIDENGDVILDPAGSSYNDYFSTGRGKYKMDASIFAKMSNDKWALHDYRSLFQANTVQDPLPDAGGEQMIRARRGAVAPYGDGSPDVDLVTRCSNVEKNIFNENHCKISYDVNACETVPAPDPDHANYIQQMVITFICIQCVVRCAITPDSNLTVILLFRSSYSIILVLTLRTSTSISRAIEVMQES